MPEEFDPYRKWLGIADSRRPPNHYRLLGIDLFEADSDVISNAADRQMAHVRTFQTSQHALLSQQLLNELAAARVDLLNPVKKAAYDARLRAQAAPRPAAVVAAAAPRLVARPLTSLPSVALPSAAPRPRPIVRKPAPRNKSLPLVIGAVLGGVAIVGVIALALTPSRERPRLAEAPPVVATAPALPEPAAPGPPEEEPTSPEPPPVEPPPAPLPEEPPAEVSPFEVPPAEPAAPETPAPPLDEPSTQPAANPAKAQPPPEAQQRDAQKLIEEIYGKQIAAAKEPGDKLRLAAELSRRAGEGEPTAAERYVLLDKAVALAIDAGSEQTAVRLLGEMAESFQIELVDRQIEALDNAQAKARRADERARVAESALGLAEEAAGDGRYDDALELVDAARRLAGRARKAELIKQLAARKKELEQAQARAVRVAQARAALESNPDDPAANLELGLSLCFDGDDWEAGLPHLAKGPDDRLRQLADLERAEIQRAAPATPEVQVALGDAWWQAADSDKSNFKDAFRTRAEHWYATALPDLNGLARTRVEKRLAAASPRPSSGTAPNPKLVKGLNCRKPAQRAQLVAQYGGSEQSEAAVEKALKWLALHQSPDGSWTFDHAAVCNGGCDHVGTIKDGQNGATGLALLPFLAAGHTPRDGKHKRTVQAGLAFLEQAMTRSTNNQGLMDGGTMYSHGIASIALCEAAAMTGDTRLKAAAQLCLDFIVYAQDKKGGGWRYAPGQAGDTSISGWQLAALEAGAIAKLQIPDEIYQGVRTFLESVQSSGGGAYGYTGPGDQISTSAIGLLARLHTGWRTTEPAFEQGLARLSELGPSKDSVYFNYYATVLMFRYGGDPWIKWNNVLRDFLVAGQVSEGHPAGSWYFDDGHSAKTGGRLYVTALCALILETYYRYPAALPGL